MVCRSASKKKVIRALQRVPLWLAWPSGSIPIMLYMHEHSNFIKTKWISFWLFYGLSAANVITCIGTYERTGLISLAVLVFVFFFRSRRKFTYAALAVGVVVLASSYVLSQGYLNRMDTLNAYQTDRSAMVRIKVGNGRSNT